MQEEGRERGMRWDGSFFYLKNVQNLCGFNIKFLSAALRVCVGYKVLIRLIVCACEG